MTGFWKIALLLPTVLYPAIGHMLVHTEDKLADCLLASIGGLTSDTIRISIEAEDATIRRRFVDTISRVLAKNDAFLVDLSPKESCIIFLRLHFVDSLKSFKHIVDRQRSQDCGTYNQNQYYFVVLPTGLVLANQQRTVEEILNFCLKAYILNVNVLVENEDVTLYTYYPFNKFSCLDSTPTIHNRFINGIFEWKREPFPPKTDNLWQCPIKAIVWNQSPFIQIEHNQIYGINGDVFKTLATMMNFSIELVMSPEGRGIFYPNNSVTGAFKLLKDGFGHISLGGSSYTSERRKHFVLTAHFHTGHIYAVVKRRNLYSSLDVLFMPFDWLTWLSLFTIFIAKWYGRLLWEKYSNRALALRNFSTRLHTMAWLYAMLIIRSSYEGSIFRCLQNRPMQWIPQDLDEAIENGFKITANPLFRNVFKKYPTLAEDMVSFRANGVNDLYMYKGYHAVITIDISLFNKYNTDPTIFEDLFLIPTPVSSQGYCMEMQKHSFLTEAFNIRIELLKANGYMERNSMNYSPMDNFLKKGTQKKRARISMHHIKGALTMFAILMAVSTCIFIFELFAERCTWLKLFKR